MWLCFTPLLNNLTSFSLGFSGSILGIIIFTPKVYVASLVAQMVKNLPAMLEMQVRSLGWEDLLEATHSNILAWTEEPGGLQCIGLQRVGHD